MTYYLISSEADEAALKSLDEQLSGAPEQQVPDKDTWGLGPDAQAGLNKMLELGT